MLAAGSHPSVDVANAEVVVEALIPLSDPLWEDDRGWTALTWAVEGGRLPLLEMLLAVGDDETARRAYAVAVKERRKECEPVLREAFASYGHMDWQLDVPGKTLRKAASDGDLATVEKALRGQPKFVARPSDPFGEPPLALRTQTGDIDALMLAARRGSADCVAALLPFSNPRRRDANGKTALMHAAESINVECVELLLPASNPNARDNFGLAALAWAAQSNHNGIDVIEALLPHVVGDVRDKVGRNAAFYALAAGKAAKAERLMRCMELAGVDEDGAGLSFSYARVGR